MHSKPSVLDVHATSPEADAELARLLRLGTLGWAPPEGGVVFAPAADADFGAAWDGWLRGALARELGEHLLAARSLGEGMKAREIVLASAALDPLLDPEAAGRSRLAGASLLAIVASARQARLADRVRALLGEEDSGEGGLHLVTAVALHSVVFPLPPLAALLGYAFAEWRAGLLALGHPAARAEAERFLAETPRAGEWAGGLLRAARPSFPNACFG